MTDKWSVFVIDVGTLKYSSSRILAESAFAWALIRKDLTKFESKDGRDPDDLAKEILYSLKYKYKIVLAIEAPMWWPMLTKPGNSCEADIKRFDAETDKGQFYWYSGTASQASTRSIALALRVLRKVVKDVKGFDLLRDQDRSELKTGRIYLCEVFAAGEKFCKAPHGLSDVSGNHADAIWAASAIAEKLFGFTKVKGAGEAKKLYPPERIDESRSGTYETFSIWNTILLHLYPKSSLHKIKSGDGDCAVYGRIQKNPGEAKKRFSKLMVNGKKGSG